LDLNPVGNKRRSTRPIGEYLLGHRAGRDPGSCAHRFRFVRQTAGGGK
jgi:hypothetical protein